MRTITADPAEIVILWTQPDLEPPAEIEADLAPCPFCGHDDLWPWQPEEGADDEPSGAWVIWCRYCAAEGPPRATPDDAAAAWNERDAPILGEDDHR